MIQDFKNFITLIAPIQPHHTILVAASAGIDSCVLIDLLISNNFKIVLAHCNFQLRGLESDENENFVKKIALKHQIPCFTIRWDIKKIASEKKISIQMAARELRYAWFDDLAKSNNFDFIATGHHKNDSLESFLLNTARGTGIAGLHGIRPLHGNILRPLLCATSEEIHQYAAQNAIAWQEDSSNISTKYYRNLIRHEVVPQLKKINPNLENTFAQSIEKITVVESVFQDYLQQLRLQIITIDASKQIVLCLEKLKQLHAYTIFCLLEKYGFNYAQAKDFLQIIHSSFTSGKVIYTSDYQLCIDRNKATMSKKTTFENIEIIIQDVEFSIEIYNQKIISKIVKIKDFELKKDTNIAYFDADKITFPLLLRHWHHGDKMQPFGLQGNKNISDILINKKITVHQKSTSLLLQNANQDVLWLLGICSSQKYCISADTSNILQINRTKIEFID